MKNQLTGTTPSPRQQRVRPRAKSPRAHEAGVARRDSWRSPTSDLAPDALLGPGTAHAHPPRHLLLAEEGPPFTDHGEGLAGVKNSGATAKPVCAEVAEPF